MRARESYMMCNAVSYPILIGRPCRLRDRIGESRLSAKKSAKKIADIREPCRLAWSLAVCLLACNITWTRKIVAVEIIENIHYAFIVRIWKRTFQNVKKCALSDMHFHLCHRDWCDMAGHRHPLSGLFLCRSDRSTCSAGLFPLDSKPSGIPGK